MLLFTLFTAMLLIMQSAARTYDLCKGFNRESFNSELVEDASACLRRCDKGNCVELTMMAFDGQQVFCGNNTQYLGNKLAQGGEMYTFAAVRSDTNVPRPGLPSTCFVCTTESCYTCKAPDVFSASGNCFKSCPAGQTAKGAGCVCDVAGCVDCVAPRYYSSESQGCVLPSILTTTVVETSTPVGAAISTTTPPTSTITRTTRSTTTPATSTITSLKTAFTGVSTCTDPPFIATFPPTCCPNNFDTGLRPVARSNLVKRVIQFSSTSTILTTTTIPVLQFVEASTPISRTTTVIFAEARTPVTRTTTTAFAQATACSVTRQVGLSQCPRSRDAQRDAIVKLLQSYRSGSRKFYIDCGRAGAFEQA